MEGSLWVMHGDWLRIDARSHKESGESQRCQCVAASKQESSRQKHFACRWFGTNTRCLPDTRKINPEAPLGTSNLLEAFTIRDTG